MSLSQPNQPSKPPRLGTFAFLGLVTITAISLVAVAALLVSLLVPQINARWTGETVVWAILLGTLPLIVLTCLVASTLRTRNTR